MESDYSVTLAECFHYLTISQKIALRGRKAVFISKIYSVNYALVTTWLNKTDVTSRCEELNWWKWVDIRSLETWYGQCTYRYSYVSKKKKNGPEWDGCWAKSDHRFPHFFLPFERIWDTFHTNVPIAKACGTTGHTLTQGAHGILYFF